MRISIKKEIFEKGYTSNWADEIYIISNIIPANPPKFILKDLENNVYEYKFYTEELQKVLYDEFPYDAFKIIKEDSQNFLVEKLNSNNQKELINKNNLNIKNLIQNELK